MADNLTCRLQSVVSILDKENEPNFSDEEYDQYLNYEEDEEIVELSEEEMLKLLDQQEDPFITCARLFHDTDLNTMELELLSKFNVEQLKNHGYTIIDNVISEELQKNILEQTNDMVSSNKLQPAGSSKSEHDDPFRDNKARTDLTAWLHHEQEQGALKKLMNQIIAPLGSDISKVLHLRKHWKQAEHQLAFYKGSTTNPGYYEKHRDAFPDEGSNEEIMTQRRVTAICYVNHQWQEGDGGKLRIWTSKRDGGHSLDIEPIGGRILLFLSGAVDHQVLHTYKDRVAITAWYS
jgi:Rps23 Pro-64 3,4-dihydroxylase Tpa1-like proline 4-hydroxylase